MVPSHWVTSESSIVFKYLPQCFLASSRRKIIDTTISLMRGSVALEKINTIDNVLLPFQRENENHKNFPNLSTYKSPKFSFRIFAKEIDFNLDR